MGSETEKNPAALAVVIATYVDGYRDKRRRDVTMPRRQHRVCNATNGSNITHPSRAQTLAHSVSAAHIEAKKSRLLAR